MPTHAKKVLTPLALLLPLLVTSQARAAASCADVQAYANDTWRQYKALAGPEACMSPVEFGRRFSACALRPAARLTSGMLGWWNDKARNGWATIGPRTLSVEPEEGTIQLGTKRTFLTAVPVAGGTLDIELKKLDGKAETEITVCKIGENGAAVVAATHTFPSGDALSTFRHTVSAAEGNLVSIVIDSKAGTKSFKYRVSAKSAPIVNNLGPQPGYADIHVHQTGDRAFAGMWMWGDHAKDSGPTCTGREHALELISAPDAEIHHGVFGRDWPTPLDTAHQQVSRASLRSAHENKRFPLNLVVITPVNSEPLCKALKVRFPSNAKSCVDMDSLDEQLAAIRDFAKNNAEWFEIAMDPWHARQIIADGKLAAVISLEASDIFPKARGGWESQLDKVWFAGVRSLQIVHETDSRFAGAAWHDGVTFRLMNVLKYPIPTIVHGGAVSDKNTVGLKDDGKALIAAMIKRHMLIDASHVSQKGVPQIFDEVMKAPYNGYPVYFSHVRFAELVADEHLAKKQGEFWFLPEWAALVKQTGGMVGIRTAPDGQKPWPMANSPVPTDSCPGSTTSFAQAVLAANAKGLSYAFGSDLNGFVPVLGKRIGQGACPYLGPNQTVHAAAQVLPDNARPNRYHAKGMATIAEEPYVIEDLKDYLNVSTTTLESSAEAYLVMWERAWNDARAPLGPVPAARRSVSPVLSK